MTNILRISASFIIIRRYVILIINTDLDKIGYDKSQNLNI